MPTAYRWVVGGVTWLALFSGETLAGRKQCLAEQDVGLDLLKYVQRTFIPAVDLNKNTWSFIAPCRARDLWLAAKEPLEVIDLDRFSFIASYWRILFCHTPAKLRPKPSWVGCIIGFDPENPMPTYSNHFQIT